MNNPALADELNLLLATETRSLFRHLDEAKPYLTPRTYPAWREVAAMSHASREHGDRIAAILHRLELPQRPVSFSAEVANYHFLSVGSLLPLLIAEKRDQVAAYQRAIRHSTGSAEIDDELIDLLAQNQAQLEKLESFHALAAGADATAGAKA
jgi:hypothetical protein